MLSWHDDTHPLEMKTTLMHNIMLDDGRGATTRIEKLTSNEPNKGLGCRLAPNAQQESEFKFRLKQCRSIANRACPVSIPQNYALNMLTTRIIPAVSYPMVVTRFSAD